MNFCGITNSYENQYHWQLKFYLKDDKKEMVEDDDGLDEFNGFYNGLSSAFDIISVSEESESDEWFLFILDVFLLFIFLLSLLVKNQKKIFFRHEFFSFEKTIREVMV